MSEQKTKTVHFKVNGKIVKTIEVPIVKPEQPLSVTVRKANAAAKKKCQHLGVQTRKTKNELCGCENKYEPVYQCLHFGGETTTTQYKHNQPERCCIGCPAGPFSADF
jgi:hypothetical protein